MDLPTAFTYLGYLSGAAGCVFGFLRWREARELNRMILALGDEIRTRHSVEGDPQVAEAIGAPIREESGAPERVPDNDGAADLARAAIGEAIARLPEREKLAITLHYYEEFSAAEIAAVLGVTPNTVRKLMSRAIERLQTALEGPADSPGFGEAA